MPKLPGLTAREIVKVVEKLGYYKDRQKAATLLFVTAKQDIQLQFLSTKAKTLDRGLLHGIIHDLDLTDEDFLKLLRKK